MPVPRHSSSRESGSSSRRTPATGVQGVGDRVRQARQEAGLSQSDVARALGYAPSLISAIESGSRRLKVDDLAKLCALLNKSADYFLQTEQEATSLPRVGVRLRAQLSEVRHRGLTEALEDFLDYAELELSRIGDVPDLSQQKPEDAAEAVRKLAGLEEPPTDLDRVTRAMHIPVIAWNFPDSLSALLADTDAGGFVIGVNRWHSSNRKRFSIAHECGHAILRHRAGFYLEFTDVDPFGEPKQMRYKDETSANAFAAALLMPKAWLRQDVREGLEDPATLAARYRVSEEAMSYRLRNVGLL
jgi:Zn-dependent peptidase ImmA (M78 family)/DNA-binding XRE family transcriptional regulator